jgi:hypothetical protein
VKLLGFELALRIRRLPPRPPSHVVVSLVRLRAGRVYSEYPGSIGVVTDTAEDGRSHFVAWAGTSGGSGPILDDDLERLGEVAIPLERGP